MVATDPFVTRSAEWRVSNDSEHRYRAPVPALSGPPNAPRRPTSRVLHGVEVVDDFAWMRQTDDPDLITYLRAENAWCDAATARLQGLIGQISAELAAAMPDEDVSAPWLRGGWEYRTRRPAGAQYSVLVRRVAGTDQAGDAGDTELLDENALAVGHEFLELGVCEPSPEGTLLAYSVDVDGDEIYTLRVRELATGADLADELTGTYAGLGWAADATSFLYTTLDDTFRPDTVRRHVLGTPQSADTVVWHEADRRFELEIEPTRSGDLVRLVARSRDTSEVRLVATDALDQPPRLVAARVPGREYFVDHQPGPDGGRLLVVTDLEASEFRVMTAPLPTPGPEHWTELLAHDPAVRIEGADAFGDYVVVSERSGGRLRLRVLDRDGACVRLVEPDAVGESVALARNDEQDLRAVRLVREGWVRPPVTVDHDLDTGTEHPVHQQEVRRSLDGFRCEVVHAVADDGVRVPLTLVRRGEPGPGAPCLLYGYGAYESSLDPEFWPEMLALPDRGVTLAIAHVRGGGELGRDWWQQGRLLRKRSTFTDFLACARHLVTTGVAAPDRIAARGLSAGGLLMGAVTHLAPTAFALVVAEAPFVDVVASMLDDTIPLTVAEWEEWGDPRDAEQFAYMLGYSPCDNLPGPRRPALLVTASRNDPRVSVHEPAKWVAKIRAAEHAAPAENDVPLLLRTAMGASSHTGPAGRYDAWAYEAFLHAVTLDRLGLT
jgi:oligopeptidase B